MRVRHGEVLFVTSHFGFWGCRRWCMRSSCRRWRLARALDSPGSTLLEDIRTPTGNTVIYRQGHHPAGDACRSGRGIGIWGSINIATATRSASVFRIGGGDA